VIASMITVKRVRTRKEQKEFLNFPLKLYRGCPYFVPPLYGEEKRIFDPDYFYYDDAEAEHFLAFQDGKVVGRIEAILHRASNEKWKQRRVRFDRFDAFDDQAIADALFAAVEGWAKEKGMEEIVGPLGFSDFEREGLLIDGFDEVATFEEQYNYPYYQKLIENRGYRKEVDWTERKVYASDSVEPHFKIVSDLMMKKLRLHFANPKNSGELLRDYGEQFFDIVDDTYRNIYMTVPFNKKQRESMIASFRLVLDPSRLAIILDEQNRCVAFGLCFPSLSKAVQKSGGRLTPPCLYRLFKAIKRPRVLDMGLIGVRPEYRNTGIEWAMLVKVKDILRSGKIEYAETNLNLEDNLEIKNTWDHFKTVLHKRRRSFVKSLSIEKSQPFD